MLKSDYFSGFTPSPQIPLDLNGRDLGTKELITRNVLSQLESAMDDPNSFESTILSSLDLSREDFLDTVFTAATRFKRYPEGSVMEILAGSLFCVLRESEITDVSDTRFRVFSLLLINTALLSEISFYTAELGRLTSKKVQRFSLASGEPINNTEAEVQYLDAQLVMLPRYREAINAVLYCYLEDFFAKDLSYMLDTLAEDIDRLNRLFSVKKIEPYNIRTAVAKYFIGDRGKLLKEKP